MRNFEISGGSQEKLLIDGNEDVKINIGGGSQISGIVKCPENTVELTIQGGSETSFYGECKHLIINKISGGCKVDLSNFFCEEAAIELIDWGSEVTLSVSKTIHNVCLKKGSVLKLVHNPQIMNMQLHSGSVIERLNEED